MKPLMSKILMGWLSLLVLLVTTTAVSAAEIDGSKPLICVAFEVADCGVDEPCTRVPPRQTNLSNFLRIDFAEQQIKGEKRATTIQNQINGDKALILQGVDEDLAWSVSLTKATGDMTGVIAGDGLGFVIFGRCTTL